MVAQVDFDIQEQKTDTRDVEACAGRQRDSGDS
jgi:hypothetical protein